MREPEFARRKHNTCFFYFFLFFNIINDGYRGVYCCTSGESMNILLGSRCYVSQYNTFLRDVNVYQPQRYVTRHV